MQSLPTGTEAKKSPHSAGEPSSPATRAGTGLGAVVVLKALVPVTDCTVWSTLLDRSLTYLATVLLPEEIAKNIVL